MNIDIHMACIFITQYFQLTVGGGQEYIKYTVPTELQWEHCSHTAGRNTVPEELVRNYVPKLLQRNGVLEDLRVFNEFQTVLQLHSCQWNSNQSCSFRPFFLNLQYS